MDHIHSDANFAEVKYSGVSLITIADQFAVQETLRRQDFSVQVLTRHKVKNYKDVITLKMGQV